MSARRLAAVLLAAGLAARVGYGWWSAPSALPNTDGYSELATSVAERFELAAEGRPTAHREPAYPVLLGLWFMVFGAGYAAALALNVLLGLATLLLLFDLGRRLFDEKAGLIALGLGALYPPFVYYAAQPVRETLLVLLALLGPWALCRARAVGSRRAWAAAGAVNALGPLANAVFMPFGLVVAPLAAWFADAGPRGRRVARIGAYLAAFCALFALWPVRNYARFGRFIWSATGGGWANLYIYMIVPQELGGTPEQARIVESDPVLRRAEAVPDFVERDRMMLRESLRRIAADPGAYARLVAWRAVDFWRPAPRRRSYKHSYRLLRWAGWLTDGPLIPLAVLGVALARLRRPELLWLYGVAGSVSLVYILIFTMLRYRLPVMPVLLLFAAFALRRIGERFVILSRVR